MRNLILLAFIVLYFGLNSLKAQYLYMDYFNSITDWTVTNSGNNAWINQSGNDSLFGVEGKCIYVSCSSCNQDPLYEVALVSGWTHITKNTAITIPSNQYKIKFHYINLIRPLSDALQLEYSYDNVNWNSLPALPMATKWTTISYPVTGLSGFTPGSNVYFRFVLNIGSAVATFTRYSCAIDNFAVVANDWDITNLGTLLTVQDNTLLYLKNADYTSNNTSTIRSSGTIVLDNGSDFINDGSYLAISSDTLKFTGNYHQTFVAPVNNLGTVLIDKNWAYQTVLLDSTLSIQDRLHFNKGVLRSGAKRFLVDLKESNNPIASDSGYVDGPVRYYANITDRLFPTGYRNFYRPIVLDNGTLRYTIRYRRENTTATYDFSTLDSVSTQGYWIVKMGTGGYPGSPGTKKTRISFKSGDYVYNIDSTRIAFSQNLSGPYTTPENLTLTHSGTASDGTVEINSAFEDQDYFIRLGFAKDGRINLNAMLQGPLMDSTKVIWEDTDFFITNWITSLGTMQFKREANYTHIAVNRPWNKAFNGLAFVRASTQNNSWSAIGSGTATADMNANVPISFSTSEKYFVEFDYFYQGNTNNKLSLRYSVNGGTSWNTISLPSTNYFWVHFKLELN